MAKSQLSKQLLAETNPSRLQSVAVGTFLAFFVFLGSFLTTEAVLDVFLDRSTFLAVTAPSYSCGDNCISVEPTNSTINTGKTYPQAYTLDRNGYMHGDTNKDGKLSAEEINAWNQTHNPDGSPKTSGGGGVTKPTGTTQTQPSGASFSTDYNCLSATGCDDF